MTAIATRGMVRAGSLMVTISHIPADHDVCFRTHFVNGYDDVVFEEAEGYLPSERSKDEAFVSFTNRRGITIGLPPYYYKRPVVAVSVFLKSSTGLTEVPVSETGFHLVSLFSRSNEEFAALNDRQRNRARDAETRAFCCEQTMLYFEHDRIHKISAALIYSYRALEFCSPDMGKKALGFLEVAEEILLEANATGSVRTDREHLRSSVGIARWHLHLMMGDFEQFQASLEHAYAQCVDPVGVHYMSAYNLCRTALAYGIVREASGQTKAAVEAYQVVVSCYKNAIALSPKSINSTAMLELSDCHRAAYVALRSAEVARGGGKHPVPLIEKFAAITRLLRDWPSFDHCMQNFSDSLDARPDKGKTEAAGRIARAAQASLIFLRKPLSDQGKTKPIDVAGRAQ